MSSASAASSTSASPRARNAEGIRQLAAIPRSPHYKVIAVPVTGCLHLKSAVTYSGRNILLANRAWFDLRRSPPTTGSTSSQRTPRR